MILSVLAFDHDRNIVLAPLNVRHVMSNTRAYMMVIRQHTYNIAAMTIGSSASRSWVTPTGSTSNCDDLAPTARRTVHAWIARNEEFGKLVHEFARRLA